MLDHMSGGRANAGFARGYQRRWVDTMAQQLHGIHGATPGEHDAIDAANRAAFEEHFRIIKECMDEGNGRVPVASTGRSRSKGHRGTSMHAAVGRRHRGRPRPPGRRRPEAAAEAPPTDLPALRFEREHDSLVRARRRDGHPAANTPSRATEPPLTSIADVSGRAPGEGLGVLRDVIVADTDDEAMRRLARAARLLRRRLVRALPFRATSSETPRPTWRPTPQEMVERAAARRQRRHRHAVARTSCSPEPCAGSSPGPTTASSPTRYHALPRPLRDARAAARRRLGNLCVSRSMW